MSDSYHVNATGPTSKFKSKMIDNGDGTFSPAISIIDEIEPYAVTLSASGSVKGTPGRLYKVIADVVGTNPTLRMYNGSSASDPDLLGAAATTMAARGVIYDFGEKGISFDALYWVLGASTATVIFVVS